jgi:hypothetical protein
MRPINEELNGDWQHGSGAGRLGSGRKMIRRNRESTRIPSSCPSHPTDTHLLTAIQHELAVGQTYLTVARLAYDMGQIGRGDQARARACESCAAAARMIGLFPAPAPILLSGNLEALRESLRSVSPSDPPFSAPLRQPSMS